ncbi:MAG: hypothetical protein AAF065_08620 [Verrucomicrobiota bacterium]
MNESHYFLAPLFSAPLTSSLLLLLFAGCFFSFGALRKKVGYGRAVLLTFLRVLGVILIVFALMDPKKMVRQVDSEIRQILVLRDVSGSMLVKDGKLPRTERAQRLLNEIESELGQKYKIDELIFDVDVRKIPEASEAEEQTDKNMQTDIGRMLLHLKEKPDVANFMGAILLTDGGDTQLEAPRLPELPLFIVGVGAEPSELNDLLIVDVVEPGKVAPKDRFQIHATVLANADENLKQKCSDLTCSLSLKEGEDWVILDEQPVTMVGEQIDVSFDVDPLLEEGTYQLRVELPVFEEELSNLNNVREFPILVRKERMPVLLYIASHGWEVNKLRTYLTKDESISLTALSLVSDRSFMLQGDRQDEDIGLEKGLPPTADLLDLYRVVILSGFPANHLTRTQQEALVDYVKGGGKLIFLGGEECFASGGYEITPIGKILPWDLRGNASLLREDFTTHLSDAVQQQLLLPAFLEHFSEAGNLPLRSAIDAGRLKPAALSLLETAINGDRKSLAATLTVGNGEVAAIATNDIWRWGRKPGSAREAYQSFWKDLLTLLVNDHEGGRHLQIVWNQKHYQVGEVADLSVKVHGEFGDSLRIESQMTFNDRELPLDLRKTRVDKRRFDASPLFREKGSYEVWIAAYDGQRLIEEYRKNFEVGYRFNEGTRLTVDHNFLEQLANDTYGAYRPEQDALNIAEDIKAKVLKESSMQEVSLIDWKGIFVALLSGVWMLEWSTRRKMNLS